MKTTKTYLQGCTWCSATGFVKIPNPGFMTSALTGICPVCLGNKSGIVTEVTEDTITTVDLKSIDQARDEYYKRDKLFERKK